MIKRRHTFLYIIAIFIFLLIIIRHCVYLYTNRNIFPSLEKLVIVIVPEWQH